MMMYKRVQVGGVVRWVGEQGWKKVKTGSIGLVIDYCPFSLVNYDIVFGCGTVMTCHKSVLEVIYEKI